jgi:L,D-transpeptidase ErfK/SrfK
MADTKPISMRSLLAIVSFAFALAGCGIVDAIYTAPDEYEYDEIPREEQAPLQSNRFFLHEGQDVIGEIQVVVAKYEDTFVDIARAYGLGYDEMVAANPDVDPWLPGEGTTIILPTRFMIPVAPRQGIVLNVAAKRLFYFPEPVDDGPAMVETYPIGIGRAGWQTPSGITTIVSKARNPIWYVPRSVRIEHAEAGDPLPKQVPPGPDNPLGNRVLGLGISGYLIHGTNKPAGVGMRVSHGCIRLFPEDIAHLYERVEIDSQVRIVNQPILYGWQNGDLLLEAHAPLNEDSRDWITGLIPRARSSLVGYAGQSVVLDEERIAVIAFEQRGFPISVFEHSEDMAAQVRRARRVKNIVNFERMAARDFE